MLARQSGVGSAHLFQVSAHGAKRLLAAKGLGDSARVDRAYLLVLSRRPASEERKEALNFVNFTRKADKKDSEVKAWAGLIQALFGSAEFRSLVDRN